MLFLGFETASLPAYQGRLQYGIGEYSCLHGLRIVYFIGTQVFDSKMFESHTGFGSTPYAAINYIMDESNAVHMSDIDSQSVFIFCNGVVPREWLPKKNVFVFHGDLCEPTATTSFHSDSVQQQLREQMEGKCVLCALGMGQDTVVQTWLKEFLATADEVIVEHLYEIQRSSRHFFFPQQLDQSDYETTWVAATPSEFFSQNALTCINLSTAAEPFHRARASEYNGVLKDFRKKFYKLLPTSEQMKRKNPLLDLTKNATDGVLKDTLTKKNKKQRLRPCTLEIGDDVVVKVSETKTLAGQVTSVHRGTVAILTVESGPLTLVNNHYVKIVQRKGKDFDCEFRKKNTFITK